MITCIYMSSIHDVEIMFFGGPNHSKIDFFAGYRCW